MGYEQKTHYVFDNQMDFVFFDKQVGLKQSNAHFHSYCQMIIPDQDEVSVIIGDVKQYTISRNDILLLLPFVRHEIICGHNSSYSTLLINLNKLGADFLTMPYMHPINQLMNQDVSGFIYINQTSSSIKALFSSMSNLVEIEYMATVFNILSLVAKSKEYLSLPKDGLYPKDLKDIQFCTTVSKYITEHLGCNMDIPKVAAVMHMSKSSFTRQFNRFFNQPFHTYVINKKIDTACYLLVTSKISIQKLSEDLGFSSLSHFIQAFKRSKNTTPAKYRKNRDYNMDLIPTLYDKA